MRLIGKSHVHGVAIRIGVHRDGRYPELPAGPHDPDRDLAAVSDQDLLQHNLKYTLLSWMRLLI